ncbi:MAG TPA: acyltransferase family protein, partial [Acidimicrobiales bacterium]
ITALLLVEARNTGRIELGRFWLRRARRLLPALFVVVAVVAIYGRFAADPLQWRAIRSDGLATIFYVANWHSIWHGATYGADLLGRSPFEHTWSLAIEEQFYLLWPLLVAGVLLIRRSPKMVLWASSAVAACSALLLFGLSFTSVSQNSLYLGTHTRIASIAFGAMVASWQEVRRGRPLPEPAARYLDGAAVVAALGLLVAWSFINLNDTFLYRGGLTMCGLAVAVIIWSVTERRATTLAQALSIAPLRGLGYISYGLYLWHWPIFLWLDESRTGLGGWTLFTVRVIVSLGVAVASYELIEQPVRRSNWSGRRVVPLATAGALVGALAMVVMAIGAPSIDLAGASAGPIYARADGKAPVVAVYGDSVAYYFGREGLAPHAKQLGVSIVDAAQPGCEPLGGITAGRDGYDAPAFSGGWNDCIDSTPTYPKALKQRPDVAVILFGGAQYDAQIDGSWRQPCDAAYADRYRQRVSVMVTKLLAQGSRVVLVRPEPVVAPRAVQSKGFKDPGQRADCGWQAVEPLLTRPGV